MSVTAAKGFSAAGVAAGIKQDALDVAVLVSDELATTAAVFTHNQAAAAPVVLSRASMSNGSAKRAVVINSGCANAATGSEGAANAAAMIDAVASRIGCRSGDVLVCSTGTIGPQLPMDLLVPGIDAAIERLASTPESAALAATAIMTTDSVPKQAVVERDGWVVGGMSKGAGMVRPSMATMLAFITTDAIVDPEILDHALRAAVDASFNSLNIDGCESTNDTAIAMASGASGITPDPVDVLSAIEDVCGDLALQMAQDAEGASRVVIVDVAGAATDDEARSLGRTVTDSALVRSSFFGGDVNWGRILGALGSSNIKIDVQSITISYEGVVVFAKGAPVSYDEMALLDLIEDGDFGISVVLGRGPGTARIITTDLTPEYVMFNGERS
ncbi:MAG: bifunctional glutamate N-acetyltransferase/amino-acid acetyltransferase ArgJ [Actinomycetota bacterium]